MLYSVVLKINFRIGIPAFSCISVIPLKKCSLCFSCYMLRFIAVGCDLFPSREQATWSIWLWCKLLLLLDLVFLLIFWICILFYWATYQNISSSQELSSVLWAFSTLPSQSHSLVLSLRLHSTSGAWWKVTLSVSCWTKWFYLACYVSSGIYFVLSGLQWHGE